MIASKICIGCKGTGDRARLEYPDIYCTSVQISALLGRSSCSTDLEELQHQPNHILALDFQSCAAFRHGGVGQIQLSRSVFN